MHFKLQCEINEIKSLSTEILFEKALRSSRDECTNQESKKRGRKRVIWNIGKLRIVS